VYGSGSLLAYNTWSVCSVVPPGGEDETAEPCTDPTPPVTKETDFIDRSQLWRFQAGKKKRISTGKSSFAVVAVDSGRIATQAQDGSVSIFSSTGALLKHIAVPDGLFAGTMLQGSQLVTLRNGKLEVYSTAIGSLTKSIPLANGARLRGLYGGLAVYVRGLEAHVVRLSDGKDVAYPAAGSGPVDAQITAAGLFVASNTPKSTAKGRVLFVRHAVLVAKR
jgi:hypothetical protein